MNIKGFQGTSLLDFPGRVASLVFFGGCNLTCPFCHNPSLVLNPEQYPDYPPTAILDELKNRAPFIDGVVISGGEPTLDPECINLLREINNLGLAVKLDTNGLRPDVLQKLLDQELIDYLAFDLKTAPGRYGELHNAPVDLEALLRSIHLTIASKIDYEFRTTCVPGLVTDRDIVLIGETIKGAKRWVFQQFLPEHSLDERLQGVESYSDDIVRGYAEMGERYVREVLVRGI